MSTTAAANPPPREYVLGTDAAELERLGLQHRLWSDSAHSVWRLAGIAPGMHVLDVGCGPGFAAFDMAAIVGARTSDSVPPGSVTGIDESQSFLDHLNSQAGFRGVSNIRTIRGDATTLGSLAGLMPASFDMAYTRWVMCFVSKPEDVVRGVTKMLKPGGRWVIQDYFNYESMCTAPRKETFAKAVRATGQSWRTRGGDPDIMGRLPGILLANGFRIEHQRVDQRLARPTDSMWHWPQSFWRNFLPVLVGMGLLTESDRVQWEREWEELGKTPGAFVVLPAVYDVVAVKN